MKHDSRLKYGYMPNEKGADGSKAIVGTLWAASAMAICVASSCSSNPAPSGAGNETNSPNTSAIESSTEPSIGLQPGTSESDALGQSSQAAEGTSSGVPSATAPSGSTASGSHTNNESTVDTSAAGDATSTDIDACPLEPEIDAEATALLSFDFKLTSDENDLELGADYVTSDNENYNLSLFALLLYEPTLRTADGEVVRAVFVDAARVPLPYGVYYVDAAAPSTEMRLLLPPGEYTTLSFELGVPQGCVGGDLLGREPPLDVGSKLAWSWGDAYMAVRLEGSIQPADAGIESFALHLGRLLGAPLVKSNIQLPGSFTAQRDASEAHQTLSLDVGRVISPRPADASLSHAVVADWLITNLVDDGFSLELR
jgi:hypothetical protein